METEAFRLKFHSPLFNNQHFTELQLAKGDHIVYSGELSVEGSPHRNAEVVTLTNELGYVTLLENDNSEVIAMQHHLVNSMEEVAEDFIDVITWKADKAIRAAIKNEFKVPDWEVNHMLIHFKDEVRHAVWKEMGSPELVHKKIKWWRRIYFSIKHNLRKRGFDEGCNGQD